MENKFVLDGYLGENKNVTPKCFMGSLYHRVDGNGVTIAKIKGFGDMVAKLAAVKPHTLIRIRGEFALVKGYKDRNGKFHPGEMSLIVKDFEVLPEPKNPKQLAAEAAKLAAENAAQAAEIAALKAALAAQQGVTTFLQQNVESQLVKEEPKVEAQSEKIVLKPIAPEEVGQLVNFQGAIKMAPNEPEVMEDINPMELIPPVGFEEHVAVNAEMHEAVTVAPQPVAQPTKTKKGLPALQSYNEIQQGIFNIKMGSKYTAVKAEEKTTEPDQLVEYKKECPFA